ncbi:Tim44/TimA family putative adaptor protein [Bosea sp. (in: a-proteobacteria)]|uniref:Tim44 domain-containing protein n=1 Tax=Bosea sp. (in: a-proteobacteria) TaxID=1871050 RepID=UPI00334248A8
MPHEADGAGLSTLLWLICIYWNLVWFTQRLTALGQAGNGEAAEQAAGDQAKLKQGASALSATVSCRAAASMREILERDGGASLEAFVERALASYEAVVTAFDAGDRDALSRLLAPDVYDAFSETIALREEQGEEAMETLFSRIEPEIVDARIEEERMEVSIRFISESFKLPRRAAGLFFRNVSSPLHGIEIWTFARNSTVRDDGWRIVATQAEGR